MFPSTPRECFEFGADALDLADRLQTPIIVMSDSGTRHERQPLRTLHAGSDSRRYDRGKVLDASEAPRRLSRSFSRYLDVDGDGIGQRTLPGAHPEKGAFFTRGTSRDEFARYTESPEAYQRNMERLERKWATAATLTPKADITEAGRRNGILYYGTSAMPMTEALELLQGEGIALDRIRIRGFPFGQEVFDFIRRHERVFVVDQNRDGQMRSLLINEEVELDPAKHHPGARYYGRLLHFGGHHSRPAGARATTSATSGCRGSMKCGR